MGKPVVGEVVVLPFPQTNLQAGKRRPALVVADLLGDDVILCQTKHNPQHFLVSGERGNGKSSLLYYLPLVGSGELDAIDGTKFRFLTISLER